MGRTPGPVAGLDWWAELQAPAITLPCSSPTHLIDTEMHDPGAPAAAYLRYHCYVCGHTSVRLVCDRMAQAIQASARPVRCSYPGCGATHIVREAYDVIARV